MVHDKKVSSQKFFLNSPLIVFILIKLKLLFHVKKVKTMTLFFLDVLLFKCVIYSKLFLDIMEQFHTILNSAIFLIISLGNF